LRLHATLGEHREVRKYFLPAAIKAASMDRRLSPTLHRVFDEILKYEGCPRLDQAAAFCNLANFDSRKTKTFRESGDD
jgi:hypothetical protein